jgi:hypothetical protein
MGFVGFSFYSRSALYLTVANKRESPEIPRHLSFAHRFSAACRIFSGSRGNPNFRIECLAKRKSAKVDRARAVELLLKADDLCRRKRYVVALQTRKCLFPGQALFACAVSGRTCGAVPSKTATNGDRFSKIRKSGNPNFAKTNLLQSLRR